MEHGFTCAIDIDGVTGNFSGKVAEIMGFYLKAGQEISSHPSFDKKKMWKYINAYDSHTPFFYSLDVMPDAHMLMDFVTEHFVKDHIFFLSASGHTPTDTPQQKCRWVKKHFGDYRVEIVTKSPDKAQFATPTTILIDDREKSIDPWIEAGGIGILHKNATTTIEELTRILGL